MSEVTEILDTDQIHDLWGAGFTIVPRARDVFDALPKEKWPPGISYQWLPIKPDAGVKVFADGWSAVPYSRHEGIFGPYGTPGDVEHGGLKLCQKRTEQVELARNAARNAPQQQIDDWTERVAGAGITGHVRVGFEDGAKRLDQMSGAELQRDDVRMIETTVHIPRDMTPYFGQIFAERDRLEGELVQPDRTLKPGPIADKFYAAIDADKGAPWWPTLHAIMLPIAIDNVRKTLKETTDE